MESAFKLPVTIVLLLQWLATGHGFNLSPASSYTFTQPSLKTFISQTRSSYFGYSINLRKSGVLVGAPRAQSNVEYQRKVNETGAVYRCSFTPNATRPCEPVHLDRQGNSHYEDEYYHLMVRSERKDHQMLGASVDGLGSDGDWLVACAPKMIGDVVTEYMLHGICYLADNTANPVDPKTVYRIKPLRNKDFQHFMYKMYNYMLGEQGFSVHVTDDGQEVLIGAPGVMTWAGTVIRYRQRAGVLDEPSDWRNVYRESNPARNVTHETVVPNPLYSGVRPYSYLGYSVSSGHFLGTQKLLYVAGAPQSDGQHGGEVIIFDYAPNRSRREMVMNRYGSLEGQQFGEYFGYSLLTEDFNSDGLPDVAVGAPLHSHAGEYDNGAVYVFQNGGDLIFDVQVKLASAYELGGRFGTSLGKIGDCNRDGYGDIAIGAPFEGNGVVYIFLGSANGLQSKPSQRLEPSSTGNPLPPGSQAMFGHAISRGVDIDGNGYNDLAIGAPNGEAVFVYRTYPIVRIEARINTTKGELAAEGGSFEFTICWTAEFPAEIPFSVTLHFRLDVDAYLSRATVANRTPPPTSNELVLEGNRTECQQFGVTVKPSPTTLHQPIHIEVEYAMAERATPPKAGPFCAHCALLDPNEYTRVVDRIPFRTGCRTDTCVSDLQIIGIQWVDVPSPYVLGSARVATLEVEIGNFGENAYLPQVNVTVPASLKAMVKSLPDCTVSPAADGRHNAVLLCDLNNRLPIRPAARIKHRLAFDMTQLEGDRRELKVRAQSFTSSRELWPHDNVMEDTLPVREFSEIVLRSKTSPQSVSLDQQKGTVNVTHRIDLHNNGPSRMRDLLVNVAVPLAYVPKSSAAAKRCQVIDATGVQVTASYNNTPLDIATTRPNGSGKMANPNFSLYVQTKAGQHGPMNDGATNGGIARPHVEGSDDMLDPNRHDDFGWSTAREKRSNLGVQPTRHGLNSIQPQDLPPNRTVFFSCAPDTTVMDCLQLQTRLPGLPAGPEPVRIGLHYQLDLDAIAACMEEREDIFVLQILNDVGKPSDGRRETFKVLTEHTHTLVTRSASRSAPMWLYVTSSFGGILLLAIITYAMYHHGFFERRRKEELSMLYRESLSMKEQDDTHDLERDSNEI